MLLQLGGDGSWPVARCLDQLNASDAMQVDTALEAFLHPVAVQSGVTPTLPALATLPFGAQANLLLLLRVAPHRFSSAQQAALLGAAAEVAACSGCGSDLLQLLAPDAGAACPAAVPPCPEFLYTPQPCFPWAPVLTDAASAAALQHRLAAESRRQQQRELQQAAGPALAKRPPDGAAQPASPAKRQRQLAPGALVGAAAEDPQAEIDAAAAVIRTALAAHAAGGSGAITAISPELSSVLGSVMAAAAGGGAAGAAALHAAGLDALQDDSLLLLLLQELVSPSSSFARCTAAAGGLLLPRLRGLQAAAARDLAAAAQHVGASSPQAFISACLRPLLSGPPGLNKHQAELISSTMKAALPQQLLPDVLAAACAARTAAGAAQAAGLAGGGSWNEHAVTVLQAALNAKPVLTAAGVEQLASAMAAAVAAPAGGAELAASAKFAKLALSVAKQAEAAAAKGQLQAVAAACSSFMAKSLAAAVAKL